MLGFSAKPSFRFVSAEWNVQSSGEVKRSKVYKLHNFSRRVVKDSWIRWLFFLSRFRWPSNDDDDDDEIGKSRVKEMKEIHVAGGAQQRHSREK